MRKVVWVWCRRWWALLGLLLLSESVWASGGGAGSDLSSSVLLGLALILALALLARRVSRIWGQSSVLGELLVGVLIGNLGAYLAWDMVLVLRDASAVFVWAQDTWMGAGEGVAALDAAVLAVLGSAHGYAYVYVAEAVDMFSRFGVLLLLFVAGLEMEPSNLRDAGARAAAVALVGVLAPMLLGLSGVLLLLPSVGWVTALFVGATLTATSIGITARLFREMDFMAHRAAHIVMGAAIFDDVLGLLILAVVSGVAVSGVVQWTQGMMVAGSALLFFGLVALLGPYLIRLLVRWLRPFGGMEMRLFTAFFVLVLLVWLASYLGLAAIVGAFVAGVLLHDRYFDEGRDEGPDAQVADAESLPALLKPWEALLVPVFFVLMGIQVKLESLLNADLLGLTAMLVVVGIAGKLLAGLVAGREVNRWVVAVGMLPRGEVGLIFALVGRELGALDDGLFSAVVVMIIVTTLITPPWLMAVLRRERAV